MLMGTPQVQRTLPINSVVYASPTDFNETADDMIGNLIASVSPIG